MKRISTDYYNTLESYFILFENTTQSNNIRYIQKEIKEKDS